MPALLEVSGLVAGYGDATVLHGVDLALEPGQVLALLGRNGMGKTTLLRSLVGLARCVAGSVRLDGAEMADWPPERRARRGMGWVPQERAVFASLTVDDNLAVVALPGAWTPARVYDAFPRLRARRRHLGGQLSGGEQQMLAIGRALVLNPRLLLLDEPLEGLAPRVREELADTLRQIVRGEGMAAIVVEQHAEDALALADRALVLERGRVAHAGDAAALRADPARRAALLGVGGSAAPAALPT